MILCLFIQYHHKYINNLQLSTILALCGCSCWSAPLIHNPIVNLPVAPPLGSDSQLQQLVRTCPCIMKTLHTSLRQFRDLHQVT